MNSKIGPLIWAQAADWCERRDELDAEGRAALCDWLGADSQHRRAYEFLCAEMDSELLQHSLEKVRAGQAENVVRFPGRQRRSAPAVPGLRPVTGAPAREGRGNARAGRAPRWVVGLAACLVIAALWLPQLPTSRQEPQAPAVAFEESTTARGETGELHTADGSRLHLNADTLLAYRVAGSERRVELRQGEVFFEVAPDPDRPFVITAGASRIEVLGTVFNVNRLGHQVEVRVYEGRVRVAAAGNLELAAGDSVLVDGRRLGAVTQFDQSAGRADWMQNWLDVTEQPLKDVLLQLQRHSRRDIVLADILSARQKVSGRFRLDQPRQSLELLADLQGLELREEAGRYILSR